MPPKFTVGVKEPLLVNCRELLLVVDTVIVEDELVVPSKSSSFT